MIEANDVAPSEVGLRSIGMICSVENNAEVVGVERYCFCLSFSFDKDAAHWHLFVVLSEYHVERRAVRENLLWICEHSLLAKINADCSAPDDQFFEPVFFSLFFQPLV